MMFRRALSTTASSAKLLRADYYRYFLDIQTRWSDQDTFAHITNSVYYSYVDTAIASFLMKRGGDPLRISAASRIAPFTVASSCDYHRPLAFPVIVCAGIAISRLGTSSVTYQVGMFAKGAEEESAAATARFVHVYVDTESQRPVPIPETVLPNLRSICVKEDE